MKRIAVPRPKLLAMAGALSLCLGAWRCHGSQDEPLPATVVPAKDATALQVSIKPGRHWRHKFPIALGLGIQNVPQMAIWLEDEAGHYLRTIYVTRKAASQSWVAAGGNRRKEALPRWAFRHGVRQADGLYLPTKDNPLPDAISGATPKGAFVVDATTPGEQGDSLPDTFYVCVEVNHSTDFNTHYPRDAKEGTPGWSGGRNGSGQPAVVWAARIDRRSGQRVFRAKLVGHSSPSGDDGGLCEDLSTLTTARDIVGEVTVILTTFAPLSATQGTPPSDKGTSRP